MGLLEEKGECAWRKNRQRRSETEMKLLTGIKVGVFKDSIATWERIEYIW